MEFIAANARKNETKGLCTEKVVEKIIYIDKLKNPKLSYTIGKDAFFASLLAKLPQKMVNSIVKIGLKVRMSK